MKSGFFSRHFKVLTRGSLKYGPIFAGEVMLFWLILMAVDSSGYGAGVAYPTDWYPLVSLLMVALAMGAGEARFHLYRRVWSVAGLNDAFAIGLAVIEASLLITIINLLFPDGYRPLRILAPVLAAPLPVFIVPAADSWFPQANTSRLRQLSADDLVGRDERQIDLDIATLDVRGRVVLVTGAAGSIGSELCRLIAGMDPRRLVLVDINESGLFDLAEELRVKATLDVKEALVSIVDREPLLTLFSDERPDLVFHAAAYKHVPMLEAHPAQAVITNVVGTSNLLRCAHAAGVQQFILISTDKAASKHSVMGCTKRLCEQLVLAYRGPMKCWAVRFGNVVGSRGSVVPLFERQIEAGGPVTITHRDVTRYMMTIREAASLVLISLVNSKPGHLYMLDMGEPIRIYDLANDLIRSRGLRPEIDIQVVITGLRPGERLTEELLAPEEGWRPTDHPSIREVISPTTAREENLAWIVERLERLAHEGRSDELVRALKLAVQEHEEQVEEPGPPVEAEHPAPQEQENA